MKKLQRGQIVIIKNEKYVVDNMIEFKEDTWVWQEYEVRKKDIQTGTRYWLTIEQDENGKEEYYLYYKYNKRIDYKKLEFEDNGKKYKLYESGVETVKSFFGPTDVDMNEKCKYYDYISENKEEILSVEVWSDGAEYTIGNKLQSYQINITEEIDTEYLKRNKSNKIGNRIVGAIVAVMIGFPILCGLLAGVTVNKSISKYLNKTTDKYTYVTSVTNNSNNEKAKVYKTSLTSLDATVKDIINGVPEGVTEVIDDDTTTENDGYAIETNKEYAYIYKHTDGKIYIQVSDKEFVNDSGTTYHSSHNTYYHRSYTRRYRSSTYYNYATSARQSSINSRKSSGGGTSSGK